MEVAYFSKFRFTLAEVTMKALEYAMKYGGKYSIDDIGWAWKISKVSTTKVPSSELRT